MTTNKEQELDKIFTSLIDFLDKWADEECEKIQPETVSYLLNKKKRLLKMWTDLTRIAELA